jgi:hypothetical protein
MKESREAARKRPRKKPLASAALTHPLRVRILEVVNEREISPVAFVNEGLAPEGSLSGLSKQAALSAVAYHFRALRKLGCIEEIRTAANRGGTEHIYRGIARVTFTAEDWARIKPPRRLQILRTMYQGLAARVEGALMTGTYDSRDDSHLSWTAMQLDETAWREMVDLHAEMYERAEAIKDGAADRIAAGADWFAATTATLVFESPSLPARGE